MTLYDTYVNIFFSSSNRTYPISGALVQNISLNAAIAAVLLFIFVLWQIHTFEGYLQEYAKTPTNKPVDRSTKIWLRILFVLLLSDAYDLTLLAPKGYSLAATAVFVLGTAPVAIFMARIIRVLHSTPYTEPTNWKSFATNYVGFGAGVGIWALAIAI